MKSLLHMPVLNVIMPLNPNPCSCWDPESRSTPGDVQPFRCSCELQPRSWERPELTSPSQGLSPENDIICQGGICMFQDYLALTPRAVNSSRPYQDLPSPMFPGNAADPLCSLVDVAIPPASQGTQISVIGCRALTPGRTEPQA